MRNPRYFLAAAGLLLVMAVTPARAQTADLRDQAFAALWNEHADRAVVLFEQWYAANPDDQDPDTRRGYALALSWNGLQGRAEQVYTRLATGNRQDADARIGLARARIWAGRLRTGWHDLRAVEDDNTLTQGSRREAGDFALRVLDEYLPTAEVLWRGNWDSDDLTTQRFTALGGGNPTAGLFLQAGPRLTRFSQPGQPAVTATGVQARLETGLAPHLSLHGTAWYDHFASGSPLAGASDKLDWNRPGADAWLTWQPRSRWRFDGGWASQAVESYIAFGKRLGLEQANLSAAWRLARWWSVGASGLRATYSDGNRRLQGSLQTTWKHEGAVDLDVTASFTHMDFTLPDPGGYWAPDQVDNGSLAARLVRRARRWTLTLEGSTGLEKETGADTVTVGGGSGRIGLRVAPDWLVAIEAGHSRSAFATSSGYSRTFAGLTVRGVF